MSRTRSLSIILASYETPSFVVAVALASRRSARRHRRMVLIVLRDGRASKAFSGRAVSNFLSPERLSQVLRERSAEPPFARRLWIYTNVAFQHPYQAVRLAGA